jgi:hypothetical protein
MESNGVRERIQVSEASAKLLIAAGKGHWVTARDELVAAKGKGDMQTYWVTVKGSNGKSEVTTLMSVADSDDEADETIDDQGVGTQPALDMSDLDKAYETPPTDAVVGGNACDKMMSIEKSVQETTQAPKSICILPDLGPNPK